MRSVQTWACGVLGMPQLDCNLQQAIVVWHIGQAYSRNEDEDAHNDQLHLHILPPHAAAQLPPSLVKLVRLHAS